MAFTGAATTELQNQNKAVEWKLELKLPEGNSTDGWTEFAYVTFNLTEKEDLPKVMTVTMTNNQLAFSDEFKSSGDTRTFIRGHIRMTATIASESEVKFDGYITGVEPVDFNFAVKCADWSNLQNECSADVFLVPDESVVVAELAGTAIQITQINTSLGASYAFPAGTANAFSSTGRRRSWKRTAVELWKTSSTATASNQLAQETYSVDYSSGAIKILDHEHVAKSASPGYFVRYVTAFKETGAGGTNIDVMRLIQQAWATAETIDNVTTGSKTFEIVGDFRAEFKDGDLFEVQNSTGNDGRYTLDIDSTFSSPNTTITVDETIPDGTADGAIVHQRDWGSPRLLASQLNLTDTGIDIDREFTYPRKGQDGKITGLNTFIRDQLGVHIKTVWDGNAGLTNPKLPGGKLKGFLVAQKASGSEDWTLYNPVSIAQPRDDRDLATRIKVTGRKTLPINEVTNTTATLTDVSSGTPDWFKWDGISVGGNSNFATTSPFMFDGHAEVAAALHNLDTTEGTAPGSTYSSGATQYSQWYNFVRLDMGKLKDIERVRLVMPPSRNVNAAAGDGRITSGGGEVGFWPGVKILVSPDDSGSPSNWFRLSPLLDGVHKPGSELDVSGDDLLVPRARWVQVLCRAYKHGTENQGDPGIGLGELEIYTDISYEVIREVNGYDATAYHRFTYAQDLTIDAVDTGAETFTLDSSHGDLTAKFVAGHRFATERTTAGTEVWTTTSSAFTASKTVITVDGNITQGTADGTVVSDTVPVGAANTFTRFAQRQKERSIDVGDKYDEFLAGDVALRNFDETLRIFQYVSYKSVSDPRIDMYDTVLIIDDLNSNVLASDTLGSILVNGIVHTPGGSMIGGTNYLASSLEDGL